MKVQISSAALALALFLGGCGGSEESNLSVTANAAPPQLDPIAAPNGGDWTQTVTQTPEGGYLLGNPEAPVKLVEYASLTCPHCRAFSEEATGPLRDTYIRSGRVSWEFRNFVLNAPDMAISIAARCQPPAAFFQTIEQIFAQQSEILSAVDESENQRLQALPPEQLIAPLARAMDLDVFFARRGMPESRFSQCIANPQGAQQLTDMTSRATTEQQVTGTPTFFINGERQEADSWSNLEPRLRAALGS